MNFFVKQEHNTLKCPECIGPSQYDSGQYNSTVEVLDDASRLEHLMIFKFYDSDGNFHSHPTGKVQESFRCSKGHYFYQEKKYGCWCGWRS